MEVVGAGFRVGLGEANLVSRLKVVTRLVCALAGKDSIPRVGAPTPLAPCGLLPQLRAHVGPDAVGAHEGIGLEGASVLRGHPDAAARPLLEALDRAARLNLRTRTLEVVEQQLLQVGTVDDARVCEVEFWCWGVGVVWGCA